MRSSSDFEGLQTQLLLDGGVELFEHDEASMHNYYALWLS